LSLRQLVVGRKSRSEMIGVFLALLELIREKKILVQQAAVDDDVEITPAPEEHRRTYVGATLHLASEEEPEPGTIVADTETESTANADESEDEEREAEQHA
jgi:chromatin segregation and condensation protein Rec8/ScpA/Scc1 (kleisin family)